LAAICLEPPGQNQNIENNPMQSKKFTLLAAFAALQQERQD
jgi:hypothetical protein